MAACAGCTRPIDPLHKFCLHCGQSVEAAPVLLRGYVWRKLRYAGACTECQISTAQGTYAWWSPTEKHVRCHTCMVVFDARAPRVGEFDEAGRSAHRTAERRRAKQQEEYEQLGRLKKILKGRPRDAGRTWETGGVGEEKVGEMLKALAAEGVVAKLNDIRVPGSTANIDHVAIAATGVHIIDAKRYKGRVELRKRGRERELWIDGSNRTKLVDQMAKQVLVVDRVIGELTGETVITPVLCFVDSDWRIRQRNCSLNGVRITYRRELEKRLREPGPLDHATIFWIAERLATRLRPA